MVNQGLKNYLCIWIKAVKHFRVKLNSEFKVRRLHILKSLNNAIRSNQPDLKVICTLVDDLMVEGVYPNLRIVK